MKRYLGTFKDIHEKEITVEIIPSNGVYDSTVNLTFAGEDPVIIEQHSDGIFSPVKTQSCTIRLFTQDIHWDLYAPASTTYYVKVYDKSNFSYFNGYLTPCIYSQDYAYKSEIELEAVDFLAVLDTFNYPVSNEKEIVSVDSAIKKIFGVIPNYQRYAIRNIDPTKYYLQEANFFDDDNEPMTCKEVLTELFNYLGVSAMMHNGMIIIYDYESYAQLSPITLVYDNYGTGTPSIELDEVYNKINIGCNLYEVDDVIDDVIDNDYKKVVNEFKINTAGEQLYSDYSFSWREHGHHTTDKHRYTMLIKPYAFVDGSIADNKNYKKSRWTSYQRRLNDLTLETNNISSKSSADTGIYTDSGGNKLFIPQYIGAYPIKQYSFSKAEGMESKTKIAWSDYLLFPALDYNAAQNNRNRSTYPAITFNNDENLAYSIDGGTGYLVFNGDLWCQSDIGISGVDTDVIWFEDANGNKLAMPVCMENMDLQFNEDRKRAYQRTKGEFGITNPTGGGADYNTGWGLIKAKLKIGDKYWNGTTWTTTESIFTLKYHDDDVNGDAETLNYYTWLKVASNPNVAKLSVGQDGYAIPITAADKLSGKLEFTMYTPEQLPRTVNNFFMRDLSLKYVFKDSTNWADDVKTDNDIIYENIINESYTLEMDELDLKINSWYKDKPISKSYMLDANKLPVVKIDNKVQEERLLEKYYNHYSTPKKIFNLNYKMTNFAPSQAFYHEQTATKYMIDSYELNLKLAETNFKLIEL